MKKLFILLTLWTILVSANTIETYTNSRFDFSINYPSDIFVNKLYESNKSIAFTNQDKSVKLYVNATLLALSVNANDVYKDEICLTPQRGSYDNEYIEVTYKAQKDNWYVLSGYNHTKKTIFYRKGFVYKKEKENILIEYELRYPIKEKKKYNKLIKIFNKSFVCELKEKKR